MPNTSYGTPYVAGSDLVSAYPTASLNLANRLDQVSYGGNGLNAQTGTSYTLVVGDAGKTVTLSNASAVAVSLPQDSAANLPTGSIVTFYNLGAGVVTISQGTGATLQGGSIILPQFANVTVMKLSANTYGRVDGLGQPGLPLVAAQSFSAVSSASVNNCFTATYDAYRIVINISSSSTNNSTNLRLRVSGTDASGANYNQYALSADATAVTVNSGTGNTLFTISANSSTNGGIAALEVVRPALAVHTGILLTSSNWSAGAYGAGLVLHQVNTAYDGFSLIASTGTITGTVRVYGYRNSL